MFGFFATVEFPNPKYTYVSDVESFVEEKQAVITKKLPPPQTKNSIPVLTLRQKQELKGSKYVPAPSDIKVIIENVAQKYNQDPLLMSAISFCESDYRANTVNVNKNGSKDGGVAQINDFHNPELKKLGLNRDNPADAYKFMAILLQRNGTGYDSGDYRHSKPCWDVAYKIARI